MLFNIIVFIFQHIQFNPNVPDTKQYKNLKENENKLKSSSADSIQNEHRNPNKKLQNNSIKISLKGSKKDSNKTIDNEEEELEFLLSLTEPVHTGPVNVKNNLENGKKCSIYIIKLTIKFIF